MAKKKVAKKSSRKKRPVRRTRPVASTAKHMVFLSHATADKWIACKLTEDIESVGAECFRDDREINGGDDIPDEIRDAIRRADEFVIILSPKSLERDWVKLEIGAAWAVQKRITFILHYLEADPMPSTFARRKAVQLNNASEYIAELRGRSEGGK